MNEEKPNQNGEGNNNPRPNHPKQNNQGNQQGNQQRSQQGNQQRNPNDRNSNEKRHDKHHGKHQGKPKDRQRFPDDRKDQRDNPKGNQNQRPQERQNESSNERRNERQNEKRNERPNEGKQHRTNERPQDNQNKKLNRNQNEGIVERENEKQPVHNEEVKEIKAPAEEAPEQNKQTENTQNNKKEIPKESSANNSNENSAEVPKENHKENLKENSKVNGKENQSEPQGFQVLPYDFDAQFKEKHKKNLYSDARSIAVKVITKCERTDSYLDKVIDFELKNDVLNDFDKALLNELTHGVIRWMRRLDWFLNGFYRGNYEKCQPEVRNAMRVALYQILFLNKIPFSAAVNEAVEFVKRLHGDKHAGVVNGLLRTIIRTLENLVWPSRDVDEVNYLGLVQSHPNWMVKRWIQRFGFDEAEKFCEFNNKRPILGLRVNRLKSNIDEVETYLNNKGIATRRGSNIDYFLTIKSMGRIYTDDFFKQGFFSVQDESAGLVSTLLDPQKGDLVLDLCAAPGGKTMHMSELMNNEGKIIAIEKYGSRAKALKNNLVRTNVTNVTVVHDSILEPESALLKEELIGKADKILLDAPCSGLGVITKKPDIKLKRELEDIQKLQKLQIELINASAKYLKPGGVMVYSTCTTEPEENFEVIKAFLEKNPEFKIDSAERFVKNKKIVNAEGYIETFPFRNFIDGSFSIRLVKNS